MYIFSLYIAYLSISLKSSRILSSFIWSIFSCYFVSLNFGVFISVYCIGWLCFLTLEKWPFVRDILCIWAAHSPPVIRPPCSRGALDVRCINLLLWWVRTVMDCLWGMAHPYSDGLQGLLWRGPPVLAGRAGLWGDGLWIPGAGVIPVLVITHWSSVSQNWYHSNSECGQITGWLPRCLEAGVSLVVGQLKPVLVATGPGGPGAGVPLLVWGPGPGLKPAQWCAELDTGVSVESRIPELPSIHQRTGLGPGFPGVSAQ